MHGRGDIVSGGFDRLNNGFLTTRTGVYFVAGDFVDELRKALIHKI